MQLKYHKYFLCLQFAIFSLANEITFIHEYFSYKNVLSVAGILCGNTDDDFELLKKFSKTYKLMAISNIEFITIQDNLDKFLFTNYSRLGIIIDLRCENYNNSEILVQATKQYFYNEIHKWLILDNSLENSMKYLDDNKFSINTDLVIAIKESDNCYKLHDVYNPCKSCGGSLHITFAGIWNKTNELQILWDKSKFSRRMNLQGVKIKIGISRNEKSVQLNDYLLTNSGSNSIDNASKFMYVMLLHVAEMFNFTIKMEEIHTSNYGELTFLHETLKTDIDLFFHPSIITTEALNNADIVIPIWPVCTCFMFRTISSLQTKASLFLQPLSVKAWYVLIILLIFASALLIIILKVEGIHNLKERIGLSFLLIMGALSQQGVSFVPNNSSGRVAYLYIMIFTLLLYNHYSAIIVADRLDPLSEKMNDSLMDLAKSKIPIAMERTKYIEWIMTQSNNDTNDFFYEIGRKKPLKDLYLQVEDGLNKVAHGSFAYYTSTDSYPYIEKTFTNQEICELTRIHVLKAILPIWSKKNCPFLEILRIGFAKTFDMGLHHRSLQYWTARNPYCFKNMFVYPISIQEVTPIFLLMLFGIFISLIVLAIENFISYL